MTNLLTALRPRVDRWLEPGDTARVLFLGFDFETSTLDGGSTRIVVATDTDLVILRAGLLRRSTPYGLVERRAVAAMPNPFFAWPGRSLYGEEYAEVIDGIHVHRRFRHQVLNAYGLAVRHLEG